MGEGRRGHAPRAAMCRGGIWRGENGIMKFGRFWQIGICIGDSDIFTPLISLNNRPVLEPYPNCQCSTTPHKAVCTPRNLHCWSDWSFTCIEDPYCPVTVLLAIAIQCFALFACFKILHKIVKFCMKLGHLILRTIYNLIATKRHILRLKCIKLNLQRCPRPSSWI